MSVRGGTHGADCQCPDEGVRVVGILDEAIDAEQRLLGLRLGVVDKVEVDKLLELQVLRHHAVDDICEEVRHVFAHGHVGNDLLDGVLLAVALRRLQLLAQLMVLTLAVRREKTSVTALSAQGGSRARRVGSGVSPGLVTPRATWLHTLTRGLT